MRAGKPRLGLWSTWSHRNGHPARVPLHWKSMVELGLYRRYIKWLGFTGFRKFERRYTMLKASFFRIRPRAGRVMA